MTIRCQLFRYCKTITILRKSGEGYKNWDNYLWAPYYYYYITEPPLQMFHSASSIAFSSFFHTTSLFSGLGTSILNVISRDR